VAVEENIAEETPALDDDASSYRVLYRLLQQQQANEQRLQNDKQSIRKMYAVMDNDAEKKAVHNKIEEYEVELIQMQVRIRRTMERIQAAEQSLLEQGIVPEMGVASPVPPPAPVAQKPFTAVYKPLATVPALSFLPPPEEEPEPVYAFQTHTTPVVYFNPPPIEGLVYRIQTGTFSRQLPEKELKGLSPVFVQPEKNLFIHYVGQFSTFDEVQKALPVVKRQGFRDAVIIALLNGKRITVKAAREHELKHKTASAGNKQPLPAANYTVVLGEYPDGLPPALRRAVAEVTGKDIIKTTSNGKSLYSIGPFSSAADAEKIQSALQTKGFTTTIAN
jgi:hypothetical protein